jgi:thiol peroxidase
MATITLKGNPIHTNGELPAKGAPAPDFKLTGSDLADASLASYQGKKKILNIFPSVDTAVCAKSAREFNVRADAQPDVVVLNVSADLPFAHARFCGAEGLERVIPLSMMRSRDFARDYGVLIQDGPLAGLAARAVVVIDEQDKVVHTQLVPEIAQEPDYDAALAAVE